RVTGSALRCPEPFLLPLLGRAKQHQPCVHSRYGRLIVVAGSEENGCRNGRVLVGIDHARFKNGERLADDELRYRPEWVEPIAWNDYLLVRHTAPPLPFRRARYECRASGDTPYPPPADLPRRVDRHHATCPVWPRAEFSPRVGKLASLLEQ